MLLWYLIGSIERSSQEMYHPSQDHTETEGGFHEGFINFMSGWIIFDKHFTFPKEATQWVHQSSGDPMHAGYSPEQYHGHSFLTVACTPNCTMRWCQSIPFSYASQHKDLGHPAVKTFLPLALGLNSPKCLVSLFLPIYISGGNVWLKTRPSTATIGNVAPRGPIPTNWGPLPDTMISNEGQRIIWGPRLQWIRKDGSLHSIQYSWPLALLGICDIALNWFSSSSDPPRG